MQHEAVEQLPGYRYDPIKRRYYRLAPTGSDPLHNENSSKESDLSDEGGSSLSSQSLPRYLISRSLGPMVKTARTQQSIVSVLADCRLSVWPPPSKCQQSVDGPNSIVRRPSRLLTVKFSQIGSYSKARRTIEVGVHSGCSVDGIPGVSNSGILEESRYFRLRINQQHRSKTLLKKQPLANVRHRIYEAQAPVAYSTGVAFDLVKLSIDKLNFGVLSVTGFASTVNNNRSNVQLSVIGRKLSPVNDELNSSDLTNSNFGAFARLQNFNLKLRWPGGFLDRGDQLVDLSVSKGAIDFQTGLAGRRAVFCLPSFTELRGRTFSPICVANSPIVGLDGSLLASNSRLLAVCSLHQILVADARVAGPAAAAVSIGRQGCQLGNFTACRFLALGSDPLSTCDPRLIVADTPRSAILFDIRRPSTPVAVLSASLNVDKLGVGHRASWLEVDARCGLVARAEPSGGSAAVWRIPANSTGNSGSVAPLLTAPAPSVGGLSLPIFVDSISDDSLTELPAGLAVLNIDSMGGCDLCFWPINV